MSSTARGEDAQPDVGAAADAGAASGAETGATGRDDAVDEERASVDVMRLLSQHVPLTLLADLAQPTGPDSPDILEHEGLPDVAWWETTEEQPHH